MIELEIEDRNYVIYSNPYSVDIIQLLQANIFNMESFHYRNETRLLEYPFRKKFDYHYFLDINNLFKKNENEYNALIKFLFSIQSTSFFISAPYYAVLYPIQVSIKCPYEIYCHLPNYHVPELKGDMRHGVGFHGIPHRFIFDQTQNWAIFYDDDYQYITIGLNRNVKDDFTKKFISVKLLTSREAIQLIGGYMGVNKVDKNIQDTFINLYQEKSN